MAVTVSRKWGPGETTYDETWTERRISENWLVEGTVEADDCENPSVAQGLAGVPQYLDAHPDIAACFVIERKAVALTPNPHGSTVVTVTYSDNPSKTLTVDGAATTTYDMMGKTERQPWDIVTTASIGADNEGAEVYRPSLSLTYEHLESSVSANIYALTGTTNNALWKGFAAGNILFLGARARSQGSNFLTTYHFLYSPIAHVVLWRPYTESTQVVGGVDKVIRVYGAEQQSIVYAQSNFALLPI